MRSFSPATRQHLRDQVTNIPRHIAESLGGEVTVELEYVEEHKRREEERRDAETKREEEEKKRDERMTKKTGGEDRRRR